MPNWCKNFLRVTGPDEDVARFQQQAASAEPRREPKTSSPSEAFSFQRLVPIPAPGETTTNDNAEFGSPLEEWGCRGDCLHSEQVESWDGHVVYQFATPWTPPVAFLRQVSRLWPTLEFLLDYDELMIAFRGTVRAQAGKLQHFHLEL